MPSSPPPLAKPAAVPIPTPHSRRHGALLMLGLVLVALNLRPALSSLAPVLEQVRHALALSGTAAGLLTTLPVLCLGVFAPLAPWLARRFEAPRTVLMVLMALAAGVALRGLAGSLGLFAGALLAGAAIGVIGVLLPAIVKREYPERAGALMGLYSMALCLGASLGAGLTVPLARAFGGHWEPALAAWALPVLVGALAWWPQLRRHVPAPAPAVAPRGLWGDRLAWSVTLYMGLQSSLAYCMFGWLPTMLIHRGIEPLQAGLMLSLSALTQLVTALSGPWLATRIGRDQRPTLLLMLALALVGLMGCLHAPLASLLVWVVLLGLGQGGQFSVALMLIVVRAPNAQVAAQLSGMSQGVGYTIAALGPLAMGLLHDLTGGWTAAGWFFAAVTVAAGVAGWGAAKNRVIAA